VIRRNPHDALLTVRHQKGQTMARISTAELPQEALLKHYRSEGAYTDCYATEVTRSTSQADYIEAFYTTWLFKLERWVLSWLARRPSTDAQARALAIGQRADFAVWHVEQRDDRQLLMCDFQGNTRSWLMCLPIADGQASRLYFGSAIVPVTDPHSGEKRLGSLFRLLLGFHKFYSRALLRAAAARVSGRDEPY
jgi:hypothetical protein